MNDCKLMREILKFYIEQIYENEESFIEHFYSKYEDENTYIELDQVYFANDRVKIVLHNVDLGNHFSTTISTMAVCDWVDNLTN